MTSKRVLIITYYWPPGNSSGVQRWLKLSKYLLQHNWEVFILTVKDGSFPSVDYSLEKDIPSNIQIHKACALEPYTLFNAIRGKKGKSISEGMADIDGKKSFFHILANFIRGNLFLPDARRGWNSFAVKKARRLIKEFDIPLVVTTSPPHSTQLIGWRLKNMVDGLKWHADFRDPWTTIYYNEFLIRTKWARTYDSNLETIVLKNADSVTVIGDNIKEEFKDRNHNISVIYNGYDPLDFIELPEKKYSDFFLIKYIGGLKSNQDIPAFWKAFCSLVNDPSFGKLRLELTGYILPEVMNSVRKFGLEEFVEINGFVDHDIAVKKMISSNMLLLIIPQSKNNKLIITGKIFEYLAAQSPILGIGPTDGDAAAILRQCGRSPMLSFEDEDGIKDRISIEYKKWESNNYFNIPISDFSHERFSRLNQAAAMDELLSRLIENK